MISNDSREVVVQMPATLEGSYRERWPKIIAHPATLSNCITRVSAGQHTSFIALISERAAWEKREQCLQMVTTSGRWIVAVGYGAPLNTVPWSEYFLAN